MKAAAFAIAGAVLAFHVLLAARTTLWDRDEPRFARAAVQMFRSREYLYPTFGGEVRAQKPILIYWLMTLSIAVLGVNEVAVRAWAPLGLAITALATYAIGRTMWSPRAGLIAMTIVALNPLAVVEGTLATTDAVLMAAITTAVAAFVARQRAARRGLRPLLVFAVAVAAALLTKGPVGLLAVAVVAGTLWPRRGTREDRRLAIEFSVATIAALAIFLAWWIPANAATGGRFFSQGVERDVIGRFFTPHEGHGGNPLLWLPFYPIVVAIGFAPWSAYLPAALRDLRRGLGMTAECRQLLVWWIACPVVVFSAAATHLPHYILPIWPALSLAVACLLDQALTALLSDATRRALARGVVIAIVCAVAASVALVAVPAWLGAPELLAAAIPAAACIIVGTIAFVILQRRSRYGAAYVAALAGTIAFESALGLIWVPAVDRLKPVPRLARMIHAAGPRPAAIASHGFDEPSLDFYLDATPVRLRSEAEIAAWAHAAGSGVLVAERVARARWGPLPLREIGSASGIDVASGKRVELVALARGMP